MEEYQYHDPVTSFLKELYSDFDFEAAQKELKEAEIVVADDFFLNEFKDEFMDNARYLISEAYCRIHQRIDIGFVHFLSVFAFHAETQSPQATCQTGSILAGTKVKSG